MEIGAVLWLSEGFSSPHQSEYDFQSYSPLYKIFEDIYSPHRFRALLVDLILWLGEMDLLAGAVPSILQTLGLIC